MTKKKNPKTEGRPLEPNFPKEVIQNINRQPLRKGEVIMYTTEFFQERGCSRR